MTPTFKHVLATSAVLVAGVAAAFSVFVGSGAYDFAADDPHTAVVSSLIETMRERSVDTRSRGLQSPDLSETTRIVQGAGNYNAMCVGCHLAPGMAESELSKGLYPAPPNLSKETVEPGHAFWVIKHGIKASGMPAWGKSMSDEYVWNMAAFLQQLPKLDANGYKEMVAHSGGHHHDHAGVQGEEAGHDHDDHDHGSEATHHHDDGSDLGHDAKPPVGAMHTHADGTRHQHKAQEAGN